MTEQARRSSGAQGIGPLVIPPTPDGEISAEDRRHLAGFYTVGGVSAPGEPEPEPPPVVSDAPQIVFARVTVAPVVRFTASVVAL